MKCQRCLELLPASGSLENENQNQNQPPARARARAPAREPAPAPAPAPELELELERERPFQKSCVHSTEISWFLSPTVPSADKSLMISYSMCPSTVFSFWAAFIRGL